MINRANCKNSSELSAKAEEREQVEKALEEERNLLRTLVDALPDLIYIKDTESRFLIANKAVTHIMGEKIPEELVGKTDFDFYPEELARQYYEDEQAIIQSGQPLINQEEPVVDQDTGAKGWLLTTKVPFYDGQGKIAGFVGVGRDITRRKQAEEAVQQLNKELEQRIEERTAELEVLQHLMDRVMSVATQLGYTSEEMTRISVQMATGAEQTSQQTSFVSSNSQQISQHVSNVSAAIEEVAAKIREISRTVTNVNEIITNAVNIANDANTTIIDLNTHSQKIGKISKVITNVAQQTKFLALNASIEAARAGDSGKGFQVVANEVKDLARETSTSAEDITHTIKTVQTCSQGAASAITEVVKIINQVSELSNTITTAVLQQTETVNEISRAIADAAQGSDKISQTISEVASAVRDSSEQAASVRDEAQKLSLLAEQLHQLVETFKV
jgi:methyl-accepting chemotaxis protein